MFTKLPLSRPICCTHIFGKETIYVDPPVSWIFLISSKVFPLILAPIYAASEQPIEGVTAEWLFRGIKDHGHKEVALCGSQKEIVKTLLKIAEAGDVVMTLGAGDVHKVGEEFLEKLKA